MGSSRQEYWSGLPFPSPGYLPNPEIKHRSPALQADSLLVYTRHAGNDRCFFCTFYIRRTNLGSSKKYCHIYFLLFLSEKDFRKCSIAQKGKSKWKTCGTFQSTKISYPKFNHSCIMRVQHSPHVPLIAKFTTSIWENEGGLVHILENHPKYLMFLTVSCRNLSKRTIKEMDDWGLFSRFSAAFQKCWKQFCNCLLMNLCCFPLGNVSLKLSPCQLSMAWFIPVKDQR